MERPDGTRVKGRRAKEERQELQEAVKTGERRETT